MLLDEADAESTARTGRYPEAPNPFLRWMWGFYLFLFFFLFLFLIPMMRPWGTVTMSSTREYQSRMRIAGMPVIALGAHPSGVIAIGGRPTGMIVIGGIAVGVVAIGGLAFGGIALGGLSLAIFALGGGAIGWWALRGGGGALCARRSRLR